MQLKYFYTVSFNDKLLAKNAKYYKLGITCNQIGAIFKIRNICKSIIKFYAKNTRCNL